ncbi:MAG: flagellar basal body-associated FliL family protein [Rhodomicrobium sp.]
MASKSGSSGAFLGVIIGTVAAIAGGFAFGSAFIKKAERAAPVEASPPNAPKLPQAEVKPLAPIIANLGNPPQTYVRLEAAVVLEPDTRDSAALAAKIEDDFVAYLRTVSITEIQGATAFQYFREDLKRRAVQQGGGKVRDLCLHAFVVE